MPEVSFPYGKGERRYQIPDDRYAGSLVPRLHTYVPVHTQEELVQEALEHPIGSACLCELAKGKQKVVILASDHTRPVPSRVIAPLMLKEIRRGNPSAKIHMIPAHSIEERVSIRGPIEKTVGGLYRGSRHDHTKETGSNFFVILDPMITIMWIKRHLLPSF